jgi:hypothetical protein
MLPSCRVKYVWYLQLRLMPEHKYPNEELAQKGPAKENAQSL